MGYVYKITNTVNNKSYIGISIHEPTQGRIKEHLSGRGNRIIANTVKKYGKEAFTYEVLEANVFDAFLPELEVFYIAHFNTVRPHGYNLTSGGDHAIPSEETRRKISEKSKGRIVSAETRRKLSEAKTNPSLETRRKLSEAHKGKVLSAKTRRKVSESLKGKPRPPRSPEHRRKISEANKGKIISAETRRKVSESLKGITRSPETRRKISEAKTGKHLSIEHCRSISKSKSGKNNPNFGKRHPEYAPARELFFSLPSDMPLREKRKLLYTTFPNVHNATIRKWVLKWKSSK